MLTDTQIRNAKPEAKLYKLRDGAGLYLEVTPAGGKHWRYRFALQGKEGVYTIGEYPHIKAAEARAKRDEAKRLVKEGTNPVQDKKLKRMEMQYADAQTFKHVADEWFSAKSKHWSDGYKGTVKRIIERDLLPHLGALPVAKIKTPMVHTAIKRIEKRGAATQATLGRQIVGSIMKLAILTSRADYDVAEPLKGQIIRPRVKHRKHLERSELGDFLRKLEDYTGHRQTVIAIRLLMMTAVRPGELTGAIWSEFDLDAAEWRIPARRMKMRKPHIVPLSEQAVALLRELNDLTGHETLVPIQLDSLIEVSELPYKGTDFVQIRGTARSYKGNWRLEPQGEKTLFTYNAVTDPGTLLPSFLVQHYIKKYLRTNFESLIEASAELKELPVEPCLPHPQ